MAKTIELNNTISTDKHLDDGAATILYFDQPEEYVIKGEGSVDAYSKVASFNSNVNYNMAIRVNNKEAKVTIEDGKFLAGYETVYVNAGTVEILGGEFFAQFDFSRLGSNKLYPYELNCLDAAYKSEDAKIIVKGGKFIGFNPAKNGSEPKVDNKAYNTNFVADGFEAVLTDEKYMFTVKDSTATKANFEKLIVDPDNEDNFYGTMSEDGKTITCNVWEVRPVNAE